MPHCLDATTARCMNWNRDATATDRPCIESKQLQDDGCAEGLRHRTTATVATSSADAATAAAAATNKCNRRCSGAPWLLSCCVVTVHHR